MKRREDWPERLFEILASFESVPFEHGRHDCGLFAGKVIEAMTGTNPAADWAGAYGSGLEATVLLRKRGCNTLRDYLTLQFGEPGPALTAKRGDLVLNNQDAVGICDGPHGVFVTRDGLGRLPLADCVACWAV